MAAVPLHFTNSSSTVIESTNVILASTSSQSDQEPALIQNSDPIFSSYVTSFLDIEDDHNVSVPHANSRNLIRPVVSDQPLDLAHHQRPPHFQDVSFLTDMSYHFPEVYDQAIMSRSPQPHPSASSRERLSKGFASSNQPAQADLNRLSTFAGANFPMLATDYNQSVQTDLNLAQKMTPFSTTSQQLGCNVRMMNKTSPSRSPSLSPSSPDVKIAMDIYDYDRSVDPSASPTIPENSPYANSTAIPIPTSIRRSTSVPNILYM